MITDEIKEALENAPIIGQGGTIQSKAKVWLRYLLQENQRYRKALETMAESEDDWHVGRTTMKEFASQALKKEGE